MFIAGLAAVTYTMRSVGVSAAVLAEPIVRWAAPLTAAVLASLTVSGTMAASAGTLTIDARLAAVVVAGLATIRGVALLPTLILAVVTAAAIRLMAGT